MPTSGKVGPFTFVPITENGNKTVIVTAEPHTGRLSRSASCVCRADDWSVSETFTATQAGNPEFVSFDSTEKSISASGGTLQFNGSSNAAKITGTYPSGTSNGGIKQNGAAITSGTAISGDPGAAAQFDLDVDIVIAENTVVAARTFTVTIAGEASSKNLIITQSAAAAILNLNKTSVTLSADGSGNQTISLTSNTDWEIVEVA